MTAPTTASTGLTLRPVLTRAETLDLVTKCPRRRAIAYAIAAPDNITAREVHGMHPESLIEWQSRAVEAVLRHREDILGAQALTS
jgi:hypothetical protein